MTEWVEYSLSDVVDIIGGGTPKTSISEYWNGDIPWLSVVDFNTGKKYVSDTEKKITKLGLEKSSTKYLDENDIIISARGTVGVVAMLDKPMTFNQSCYGIRAKQEKSTNEYIYYLLKDTVRHLQQVSYGAVFDTITKTTFDEVDISLPSLEEQKAIAEVLSSLDDKIDLLHRQSQTLEELAQTLFRQWFIEEDFNSTIGDIINLQSGFAFKSKDFQDFGSNSVIKIKNISNSIVNISESDFIDDEIAEKTDNKFKISSGDILFAMTGAEIGKMGVVPNNDKNLWLNQRVGMLNEKFNGAKYLAYLHLTSEFGYDYIVNTASGSAQPNISATDIEKCPFVKLEDKDVEKYSKVITPMFEKIIFNLGQIHSLINTRDTLLPKLMSGEVRVKI